MPELDLQVARWLVGPEGLAAVAEATRLLDDGANELHTVTSLRASIRDPSRTGAAVAAGLARRRARQRWPDADRLLFTREALEQASDPNVADWRAARLAAEHVHDLCSGIGGDAMAIARRATSVTAVDRDPSRLILLAHNVGVVGLEVDTRVADALDVEVPSDHLVHVDPARRSDGRRLGDPTRTLPPVDRLVSVHAGAPGLAIVLAPGTDAAHPALGPDVEVEYIQLGDDLIEAVAWSGTLRDGAATASATILPRTVLPPTDAGAMSRPGPSPHAGSHAGKHAASPAGSHVASPAGSHVASPARSAGSSTPVHRVRVGDRGPTLPVGPVGDHLVEVAAAAIRARLHDDIGAELGARRLAKRRALLTVDGEPPASPWYRVRPVVAVLPARAAALRAWLATADEGPLEVVLHGVSLDPDSWWRELGRPPRGPGGIRIELVRRDDDRVAVVTRDVPRDVPWDDRRPG